MNYLRYIGIFLGTALVLAIAIWALRALAGVNLASSGIGIIPPLIAAMVAGQVYARDTGRVPDSAEAWRFAVVATLISIGLAAGLAVIAGLLLPVQVAALRAEVMPAVGTMVSIAAGFLGFLVGVTVLVNRFFLTFGARNMLKGQKKPGG